MTDLKLYHNPRCSKSRAALQLLQARGLSPQIIPYLDSPLNSGQLQSLLQKLGISARQLLRSGEDEYKALALSNPQLSESELIEAMVQHPRLIERPILETIDRAVIGRPPETILELL